MSTDRLADFLAAYPSPPHGRIETDAERRARIDAWDALPPFERSLASILYSIEVQVGNAHPDQHVTFFASTIQSWGNQLRSALEMETAAKLAVHKTAESVEL